MTIRDQEGLKFAVIRDVCDGAIPNYTQPCEIIGAYRQTVADPGLFRRAIAIAAFPDIYRNKTEAKTPRRKLNATVKVHFENGKSYQYNCTMAAAVGDHVRVGVKLADQIGTITEVLGSKSRSPYMQEIVEVIEQGNGVCVSSHEWTFGLTSEDCIRPKAWRKPKNSVSVQIQFDNETTLTYNSDYYVAIGDAVYVTGKYWGEFGTVTAFEGAWIHDYHMKEVLDVYEEMSEKIPLYIEHPKVIDDDYPFAYDRPNEMVRMINMARGGDQDAIRRLISIYSDKDSPFYHERKATYWKSKEN